MSRIGALIVGIGAYDYGRASVLPDLKHAAADADGIETYVRACWPAPADGRIVRVAEAEATLDGVRTGFAALAEDGPYDLQLVYLAGHGLVEPDQRGFLVQPSQAAGALSLLDSAALDELLDRTKAERTVFILDCCYAEAVVAGMDYFKALAGDRARLYVASSRAGQKTWEEDEAGHGVFTAHLLDLLNTGSSAKLKGARDALDVDGELFPILCDQVPLYVLDHKSAAQEPVKGGVASAAVTLPVARRARRIKERTALGTALRRMRQIAGVAAVAAFAGLLFAYSMLYYIEPDSTGTLSVRHGTRWLEPTFRLLRPTRVGTGIAVADLLPDAGSYPLKAGHRTGVWTQLSRAGYRSWFDTIVAGLTPEAAARYDVLMGTAQPLSLSDEALSPEVERAAWTALNADRPGDLDAIYRKLPAAQRLTSPNSEPFNPNLLDFGILDQKVEDMQRFGRTLQYGAALNPQRTFPAFVGFARAAREWVANHQDLGAKDAVRDSVADAFEALVRARLDRGLPAIAVDDAALLERLSSQGYADVLDGALSRAKGTAQAQAIARRSLSSLSEDPFDPKRARAMTVITASLDASPASRALVDEVYARLAASRSLENSATSRFLIDAAEARALSPALVARLVQEAKESLAKPERDFMDSERARILAHAMGQVPIVDRADVYRLIDLVSSDVTPMASANAERYAALGRQGLDRAGMLEKISAQARLAKPYAPVATDGGASPPGMTIVVGRGPWIAALAVYGQSRHLAEADVKVLRDHAADPALSGLVTKALIEQERLATSATPVQAWIQQLAANPTNAVDRQARQNAVAAMLAQAPRGAFLAALVQLRTARDAQVEPEVRIALGTVMADALYGRVRPTDWGLGLFE